MKTLKKCLIFCFILVIILIFSFNEKTNAEEVYCPYPIIFVSGIGTSTNINNKNYPAKGTWKYIIFEYLKYFGTNKNSKYFFDIDTQIEGEKSHLEFLVYDGMDDAITLDADILKTKIDSVLKRYYTDEYNYVSPCKEPKVILICHSMGG